MQTVFCDKISNCDRFVNELIEVHLPGSPTLSICGAVYDIFVDLQILLNYAYVVIHPLSQVINLNKAMR